MALSVGTRVGLYEVTGILGAGGMGEVYRAHDTKLGRDVALKVLPELFGADADRLTRFRREAQLLASLNHPNIATIFGLEESNAVSALVLELVEGATLADRIARGRIPIAEALPIARQIVEAIETAHECGVVHRDLKPANIKVTAGGVVKVLDFGLAKTLEPVGTPDLSNSPTLTNAGTQAGVILGTVSYMSPEQARGLAVNRQTDIWAFGCVLYEMLAGRQAFVGGTATDITASIIRGEPDWDALPADTPVGVQRVIRRCLQKDPKRRLRDIADVLPDLEEAPEPAMSKSVATAVPQTTQRLFTSTALVIAAVILAVAFAGRSWLQGPGLPAAVEWYGERLGGPTMAMGPRLSPDGQLLAFSALIDGLTQVAVMKPQSGNWTTLTRTRTRGLVQDMTWSKDATRIFFDRYFDVPQGIYSVPALGGEERLVLENAMSPQELSDGTLLVTQTNASGSPQLFRLWPDSSRLEALPALLAGFLVPAVRALPDGHHAVFYGRPGDASSPRDGLYIIDLDSKQLRRLAPSITITNQSWGLGLWGMALAVTRDGRFVRFDLPSGNLNRIVEVPTDGTDTVRTLVTLTQRPLFLDVADDGSMYVDQIEQPEELISFSPGSGKLERLPMSAIYEGSSIVPLPDGRILLNAQTTGRTQIMVLVPGQQAEPFIDTEEPTRFPATAVGKDRVAFVVGAGSNEKIAIATMSDGRIQRRLATVNGGDIRALAGSADGKTLFYAAAGAIWAIPTDDGVPRRIHDGASVATYPTGDYLLVKIQTKDALRLVRVSSLDSSEQPIPVKGDLQLSFDPLSPNAIAPDGRIAVRTESKDSWYWPAGILDPRTGIITRIPLSTDMDMLSPGWTSDGRLITTGHPTRSTLWRFQQRAP